MRDCAPRKAGVTGTPGKWPSWVPVISTLTVDLWLKHVVCDVVSSSLAKRLNMRFKHARSKHVNSLELPDPDSRARHCSALAGGEKDWAGIREAYRNRLSNFKGRIHIIKDREEISKSGLDRIFHAAPHICRLLYQCC